MKNKAKRLFDYYRSVVREVDEVFRRIDERAVDKFIEKVLSHRRIYIAGVGRSGLVVKAFGQRLMHLGFEVHLADEITAPAITKGDLLICCSGTGETQLTLFMSRRAAKVGCYTVTFTADEHSPLAKASNHVIKLPAPLSGERNGRLKTGQPARSLFEQALFLLFDSIVLKLIDVLRISRRKVTKRHANLE